MTSALASLLTPWPLKFLVDYVLSEVPLPEGLSWVPGAGSPVVLIAYAALGSLALFAAATGLDVASTMLWVRVGQGMVYELAADTFAALQRRSMKFHQRYPLGETMNRVMGDSWVVHSVVGEVLFKPLQHALLLAGMAALVVHMNARLALIALGLVPFIALASLLNRKRLLVTGEHHRRIEGELHSHLHQTLSGMPVIQAFGQENRVVEQFDALAAASVAAEQRKTVVNRVNALASGTVNTLGNGLVLFLGAKLTLSGGMSVGELLVFVSYLKRLQSSLTSMASIYPALRSMRPRMDRVLDVLDPEEEVPDGPLLIGRVRGHVRFENVRFRYDKGAPALDGVSFEARPGETVALVGATGAGKSTIANLLMRFYDPQDGRVLLDDLDLRMLKLQGVREQIAYVPQEAYLFQASIADNIGHGNPDADPIMIEAAARLANVHDFIMTLPAGYDPVVGGRVATMSGGQRQRVAIARAILKDAPVLILDEPTSALDAQTEALLMTGLEHLMEGRTTLVIAHRLSTIRRADRIVVLDQGRVVETGTHRELIAARGFYARLHSLQFAGHDDEIILDDTLIMAGGQRG